MNSASSWLCIWWSIWSDRGNSSTRCPHSAAGRRLPLSPRRIPAYALRRLKDPATDAIGKDPTHINCHPPQIWRGWCEENGFVIERHFSDGLWDVPYLPLLPKLAQFALFGLPALAQVLTRGTFNPLDWGVNQIVIARKPDSLADSTALRKGEHS